ncbi:hypothetical protein GGF32_003822 [Allomyces javanicus]|nr:hypothetical protein GGF32_003822 [Allomyces javanicus]
MNQIDAADFTVAKAVKVLSQFVELGNSKGAFSLREANMLSKAIDILSEDVQDKPTLVENDPNPEATAKDLLVQAVHVAQSKGAYGLRDAALAYDLTEYLRKQAAQAPTESKRFTKPADDDDAFRTSPVTFLLDLAKREMSQRDTQNRLYESFVAPTVQCFTSSIQGYLIALVCLQISECRPEKRTQIANVARLHGYSDPIDLASVSTACLEQIEAVLNGHDDPVQTLREPFEPASSDPVTVLFRTKRTGATRVSAFQKLVKKKIKDHRRHQVVVEQFHDEPQPSGPDDVDLDDQECPETTTADLDDFDDVTVDHIETVDLIEFEASSCFPDPVEPEEPSVSTYHTLYDVSDDVYDKVSRAIQERFPLQSCRARA